MQKKLYGFAVIGVVVLLNSLLPGQTMRNRSYEEKVREKIVGELRQEIKDIVKEEVQGSTKEHKSSALWDNDKFVRAVLENPISSKSRVPVKRDFSSVLSNRNVRELVNAELDLYRAGALVSGTQITKGLASKRNPPKNGLNYSDVPNENPQYIPSQDTEAKRKQKDRAVERTLIDRGGLLLPRGTLQVEPSFTTAHFSSNRVNIEGFSLLPVLVIGEISTEAVKRDIHIGALSLKYGLWNNLQAEVKVPYRYEFDRVTSNLGVEKTRDVKGFGDIETTLSRQIFHERGMIPDTILSLGIKSATADDPYTHPIGLGTGLWSSRASLVMVKSSDPAVVFGMLNYTWNYAGSFANVGQVDPGNSIGYGIGTALALSYQTAMTFQFEHSITDKMKRNGFPIAGSFMNVASLKTGFTWTISEKSAVDFGVSMGLTTDAPDYVVELRIPHTF